MRRLTGERGRSLRRVAADPEAATPTSVAIVYDCIYPQTRGGAERWYRNLADRLDGGDDCEVTYLTRRQWGDEGPGTGFRTVAVSGASELYGPDGNRRILPPVRFGLGVFLHLLRHARRYEVVHTASFPYFSVLGAWLALKLRRSHARLVVDWHEYWGPEYWRRYLGPFAGRVANLIERICLRLPDRSIAFSQLVAGRLKEAGHRAPLTVLTGEFAEPDASVAPIAEPPDPPVLVAVGRQIKEKRLDLLLEAMPALLRDHPGLRARVIGDGPEAERLGELAEQLGIAHSISFERGLSDEDVSEAMRTASCLVHPSEREGYGLVLIEAASLGTPVVAVPAPQNAATELVEEGSNGFVAEGGTAAELAAAVSKALVAGAELRVSTAAWYSRNREGLSIESSIAPVLAAYSS